MPVPCNDWRRRDDRSGTTAIEFACVAPLFFLLVLGMVEFGRAMMVTGLLTNAAQVGARAGVLDGAQVSDVTSAVSAYLTAAKISGVTTTVSPSPPSSAGAGQNVTVSVSVAYTKISWLPAPWFLGNTTLSAQSIMKRETGL